MPTLVYHRHTIKSRYDNYGGDNLKKRSNLRLFCTSIEQWHQGKPYGSMIDSRLLYAEWIAIFYKTLSTYTWLVWDSTFLIIACVTFSLLGRNIVCNECVVTFLIELVVTHNLLLPHCLRYLQLHTNIILILFLSSYFGQRQLMENDCQKI